MEGEKSKGEVVVVCRKIERFVLSELRNSVLAFTTLLAILVFTALLIFFERRKSYVSYAYYFLLNVLVMRLFTLFYEILRGSNWMSDMEN